MFKVAFLVYAVFAGDVVYDKLKEIRHNVPLGDLLYTYKPMMISVGPACKAYPAVDGNGNTNRGLPGNAGTLEQCRSPVYGQLYGRRATYARKTAYAYCAYFPQAVPLKGKGHRHDWACVTIWIYKDKIDEVFSTRLGEIPVSKWKFLYGKHLRMFITAPDSTSKLPWSGHWLEPASSSKGPSEDHLPLLDYDTMPTAAREALEQADFEGNPFPLRDNHSAFSNFLGSTYNYPDVEAGGIDEVNGPARADYNPEMEWDPRP